MKIIYTIILNLIAFSNSNAQLLELSNAQNIYDCKKEIAASFEPNKVGNWNGWGNNIEQTRAQTPENTQLSIEDIPKLKLKWATSFPGSFKNDSQPNVYGGLIFTSGGSERMYAINSKNGCVVWSFQASGRIRSAVTVAKIEEKYYLFFGDLSSHAYAVSPDNGKLYWRTKIENHKGSLITGAPTYHNETVYFPVAGGGEEGLAAISSYECCTFRGSIAALNAKNGALLWKVQTIKEGIQNTGKNKKGVNSYGPSGAGIWSSPSIDSAKSTLYATTGNNFSLPGTDTSDAIIEVSLINGSFNWVKQITKDDVTNISCYTQDLANCPSIPSTKAPDHDFASSPIIAKLSNNKKIIIAGQKSGVVTAVEPDDNGNILWQTKIGKGGNLGGIQYGMAYLNDTIYAAVADTTIHSKSDTKLDKHQQGIDGWYLLSAVGGGMYAIDASTGKLKWATPHPGCNTGGTSQTGCSRSQSAAVTVINDVVFSGGLDGHLRAYDTQSGKIIWDMNTNLKIKGNNGAIVIGGSFDGPGPVIVNGVLYVNSGYQMFGGYPGNALFAFSVDGK